MTKSSTRIALWAGTAVVVTAVASVAISASVGERNAPLSAQDVARQLADDSRTPDLALSTQPGTAPTVSPTDMVNPQVFGFAPGTVVATCIDGLATLRSWTPNPGYYVDDVSRGPAAIASLWFESDTADDVRVDVACSAAGGEPQATTVAQADDHGGHGGGNGGGDNSGPGSDGGGSGRDHPEDD